MGELTRVLIANRGEIAVRVVRACREAGIDAVVAVTTAERDGLAASLADATAEVDSYLDADALVGAAVTTGADAIHPGYGFLAEDPRFAEAVINDGLRWIGPPPAAMRALGDKVAARAVAIEAGVPVVPGFAVDEMSDDEIVREAEALGVPLLVKASSGGGGRGMRAVDHVAHLLGALADAREEAARSFGDGTVFVERRLDGVCHVEVQLLIDDHDHAVHLGERDCSLQRRHQKILEESPSPAVDHATRAALGEAAIAVATHAGYRGAGTVEFLLRGAEWWFLEMNARLQVEHPVTECVTGIDLVRAQLAIAAGEPLPLETLDGSMRGHAIEARVYAEDPANGFLPTAGRVKRLDLPLWPGVRIDTALREGDTVGLGFDPLLAKVIAWAEDRPTALARLRAALSEVHILGLTTNLGFLLDALADPTVVAGEADTDWVEGTWRPVVPTLPPTVIAATNDRDPWRAFGVAGGPAPAGVVVAAGYAQFRGWHYSLGEDELLATDLPTPGGSLTAPMPSTVLRVDVAAGDVVDAGQTVALLEAMKMQLRVTTPARGVVRAVHIRAGDVVAKGDVLVELEESA